MNSNKNKYVFKYDKHNNLYSYIERSFSKSLISLYTYNYKNNSIKIKLIKEVMDVEIKEINKPSECSIKDKAIKYLKLQNKHNLKTEITDELIEKTIQEINELKDFKLTPDIVLKHEDKLVEIEVHDVISCYPTHDDVWNYHKKNVLKKPNSFIKLG